MDLSSEITIQYIKIPKNTYFVHCENHNFFPKKSLYPINPITFFTMYTEDTILTDHNNYWGEGGLDSSVVYSYKSKKPLKLLVLETLSFHDHLEKILNEDDFDKIPYNISDFSFPYESSNTYVWDYIDCALIAKLTDVDGIVREDECILFDDYKDKIEYISHKVFDSPHNGSPLVIDSYNEIFPYYNIYYEPSNEIIKILKNNVNIRYYEVNIDDEFKKYLNSK